jgi:hypothetical protein
MVFLALRDDVQHGGDEQHQQKAQSGKEDPVPVHLGVEVKVGDAETVLPG